MTTYNTKEAALANSFRYDGMDTLQIMTKDGKYLAAYTWNEVKYAQTCGWKIAD